MFGKKPEPRAWVLKALARAAKPTSALEDATPIRALGVDSLGLTVLFAEFCESYSIDVETFDPSAVVVHTVGDLVTAAEKLARGRR